MNKGKFVLAVILILSIACMLFMFHWLSGYSERSDTIKSNIVGEAFTAKYEETYFPPESWLAEKYSVITETYTFNNDGTVTVEKLERYTDSFVVIDGDIRLEHSDSSVKTYRMQSVNISMTGNISIMLSNGTVIGIEVDSSYMPVSITVDSRKYK